MNTTDLCDFYKFKSAFVTGNTGFKGAWLCEILRLIGANITGYALPYFNDGAYDILQIDAKIVFHIGDIRNYTLLKAAFDKAKPEIVFHLAAQPLVLDALERPQYTFDVNIQGTVNLLECCRQSESVKSIVIVTTDKVYKNNEWIYGYRENDTLGDIEPYAASKACVEIVAESYAATFFKERGIALSTVRAGNVIGGGDISKNRIIPDCIRAANLGELVLVRNPHAIRPYQHVLEPLFAYLMLAKEQYSNPCLAGQYNIGPNEDGCVTTGTLVDIFCNLWGSGQTWKNYDISKAPHESGLLKLDCSKMRSIFGWKPRWDIQTAVAKTIEWEKSPNKQFVTDQQIEEYAALWRN